MHGYVIYYPLVCQGSKSPQGTLNGVYTYIVGISLLVGVRAVVGLGERRAGVDTHAFFIISPIKGVVGIELFNLWI